MAHFLVIDSDFKAAPTLPQAISPVAVVIYPVQNVFDTKHGINMLKNTELPLC